MKNRTYYFFNDIINIEEFNSNLLKKFDDYESIYSLNPLHLIIGKVDGHIEEKNENKYLVFDSTDENRKVLEKYTKIWNGVTN